MEFHEEKKDTSTSWRPHPILKNDWRYWVIEIRKDKGFYRACVPALLSILNPSIRIVFTKLELDQLNDCASIHGNVSCFPQLLDRIENDLWDQKFKTTIFSVQSIIEVLSRVEDMINPQSDSMKNMADSIRKYYDLQLLPFHSPMYILGLFSVIESLITHAPKQNDIHSSIASQIASKLELLNKTYFKNFNVHDSRFHEIAFDKLWKKLYSYRSQIAHTAKHEISGDLHILKSPELVRRYVEEQTKELLRFSLSNHEFLKYLKAC